MGVGGMGKASRMGKKQADSGGYTVGGRPVNEITGLTIDEVNMLREDEPGNGS